MEPTAAPPIDPTTAAGAAGGANMREGWYLRMDNVSGAEAQFTPAVLCIQYLS